MTVQRREDSSARASLELLYNISRELAMALDLRTVLQRVVFLAMENTGATTGTIIVLDDIGQPIDSIIIVDGRVHQDTTQQLRITFDRGLAGWVARHSEAVLIPDTSKDKRWLRRPDDSEDRSGAKCAVSTPIKVRDNLVGILTLVHRTPGTFTSDHLALIQAIGDQAGIAVMNARLYNESQSQARVMTAVAESAAVITASLDLKDLLNRILNEISQALRVEVVSLALIDPGGETLTYQASTAESVHSLIGLQVKLGQDIIGWVAREGKGEIVQDVRQDPRFDRKVNLDLGFEARSVACTPVVSQGEVIGVIEAVNPLMGTFNADSLHFLNGIASLAGTAIRHAQLFERLQAAHQRYRDLFEDSIDPILITDLQGRIMEANRQVVETSCYTKETLMQMSIGQLHELDEEHAGLIFEDMSNDQTISYESTVQTHKGHQLPVQVNVRRVEIDGRGFLQWILRDISERKKLDSLREDLTSMIYHDIRSPLANVVSSLDVFESLLPPDSDPSFRSLLNIAMRSTERIQRLTNSLLDMNRLEAGKPIVNLFTTSPHLLASDALDAISPVAENKGIHLELTIPEDLSAILVDADMIRRVLSNLLENAVKFTPPGGTVTVGAIEDGAFIRLWVQDTGSGIPDGERERIFDKYARLKEKDSPKGFGLGLAYCRLAVEGHGGRIWVESQLGEGARFCFTLPQA
jgi:two-component system, NtrC family, sensor histidine kinase KinB